MKAASAIKGLSPAAQAARERIFASTEPEPVARPRRQPRGPRCPQETEYTRHLLSLAPVRAKDEMEL